MKRWMLIVGIILIILWVIGFFVFHFTTPIIHGLVILGGILVIFDLISKGKTER